MNTQQQLGIAYFDYGIAVDPQGVVTEFSKAEELSDNCIWVTDRDDRFVETHLAGRGRFKSDTFFSRRLKMIVSDLGLQGLNPKEQAQVLQAVLAWSFDRSSFYIGSVPRSAKKLASVPRTETRQKHMKPVLESAGQRYCSLSPLDKRTPFVLYQPASSLFHAIKDTPFPSTSFRLKTGAYIQNEELMLDDSEIAFVLISDAQSIEALSSLSFWNLQTRIKDFGVWLTTPEYKLAVEKLGCLLPIQEGLASLSHSTIAQNHDIKYKGDEASDSYRKQKLQEQVSYSVFLNFEALLGAYLGIGAKRMTFSEIYLSSVVRMLHASYIERLQNEGFGIQGYGGGRIALSTHPLKEDLGRKKAFLELAIEMGLMVPTTDFGIDIGDQSTTGFGTFFSYACTGDSHSLCQLNHYVLES